MSCSVSEASSHISHQGGIGFILTFPGPPNQYGIKARLAPSSPQLLTWGPTHRLLHDNLQGDFSNLSSISLLLSQTPWLGRLLSIINRDSIICKPHQLQSDLLLSPSIELVCIRRISPKRSVISLQS